VPAQCHAKAPGRGAAHAVGCLAAAETPGLDSECGLAGQRVAGRSMALQGSRSAPHVGDSLRLGVDCPSHTPIFRQVAKLVKATKLTRQFPEVKVWLPVDMRLLVDVGLDFQDTDGVRVGLRS